MLTIIVTLLLLVSLALQQVTYAYHGYAYNNVVIGSTFDSYNKYFIAIESGRFFGFSYNKPSTSVGPVISTPNMLSIDYEETNRKLVLGKRQSLQLWDIASGGSSYSLSWNWNHEIFSYTCVSWPNGNSIIFAGTSDGRVIKAMTSTLYSFQGQLMLFSGYEVLAIKRRRQTDLMITGVKGGIYIFRILISNLFDHTAFIHNVPLQNFALSQVNNDDMYLASFTSEIKKVTFNGVSNAVVNSITVGTGDYLTNMETVPNIRLMIVTKFDTVYLVDLSTFTQAASFRSSSAAFISNSMSPSMYITGTTMYFMVARSSDVTGSFHEVYQVDGLIIDCPTGSGLYWHNYSCISFDSIPDEFGADNSTMRVQRCEDRPCKVCKKSYLFLSSHHDNSVPFG